MLTLEQYIIQMKKRDKLDEFNFTKHAENMATAIRYVTDYFNDYLEPETYDYEKIKLEQTIEKVKKEVGGRYPQSINFIIEYYKKTRTRIDRYIKSWCKDEAYFKLFYSESDYIESMERFLEARKLDDHGIEDFRGKISLLIRENKEVETYSISLGEFKHLNNEIIAWVKQTYRNYGVNLFDFVEDYTYTYYEAYVEHIYDRQYSQSYFINKYNYRYNDNPFDIDELYENNAHREFLVDKKGELEMLIMYSWLFNEIYDEEYWPEYVNLCVANNRVSIVRSVNVLLPVRLRGINYPEDIISNIVYRETTNGLINETPSQAYILKLSYLKENDGIWKNNDEMDIIIKNLKKTFKEFGMPIMIEISSPLRTLGYNEAEFLKHYASFERAIGKIGKTKIALLNGAPRYVTSKKPRYLLETVKDITNVSNAIKEMKLKLRLSVDIGRLLNQGRYEKAFQEEFNELTFIRSMIIGIHLSTIPFNVKKLNERNIDDKRYLSHFDYNRNSDYLGGLTALFNDNQSRYFVPEEMADDQQLEELVDTLLRGGFSFASEGEI